MINILTISKNTVLRNIFGVFLKLLPANIVVSILYGKIRGKKWIKSAGVNAYCLGTYEIEKQKLFEKIVKPNDIVFDIGAHVGFYTLLASELVGESGKVFAFEPLSRNINYLKRHIALNKCNNVFVMEAAVCDKAGEVYFEELHDSFYGRVVDEQTDIKVASIVLDNLLKNDELPAPNVLKIDVEGNELLVLKGAENILQKYHPVIFLATHSEKIRNDCFNFLENLKYNFKNITDKDISEIFAY